MSPIERPRLDPTIGLLSHGERSVKLTPSECLVLARLMRGDGQMVSRECVLAALYNDRRDGGAYDKIVDVFVCKIRGKAASIGLTDFIYTDWGRGWHVTAAAPRVTLGLTNAEWVALQVVVSSAVAHNAAAAERVREAMHRAAIHSATR